MDTGKFIAKIDSFIRDEGLISAGDTIVCGVSGGADSVCLFKVLCELKGKYGLKLVVVTVDHGLRAEAKEEMEYVESLSGEAGVTFIRREADVKGLSEREGIGTEEAGRKLRYEIFEEIRASLGEAAKIAVAHNMNDVSETFLFNLFRGTGPKGLGALRPKREHIIRPLLCVERKDIEAFLEASGTKFYTDASNLTDEYTRNKIRHHIVEYAGAEINEAAVVHIAESAAAIRRLNDLAESEARLSLEGDVVSRETSQVTVKRTAFTEPDPYIAQMKAKFCIDFLVPKNKDITAAHLNLIRKICGEEGTKYADLPYGIRVTASGELVRFERGSDLKENREYRLLGERGSLNVEGLGTVSWEVFKRPDDFVISQNRYTKSFDYDKISGNLAIRFMRKGDYLTIDDALNKKKLSDYFTNEKVPVFEREQTYLLCGGDHVFWVIGKRISAYPKVSDETKRIITITVDKEEDHGEAPC